MGYINPYNWIDDHTPLYGNNASLDPSANECDTHMTPILFSLKEDADQVVHE